MILLPHGERNSPGSTFDWIVGNPPWIEVKRGHVSREDRFVWEWMQDGDNRTSHPVGGNQVAEAFAWKVMEHLSRQGEVAFLLPAITLFKNESTTFRKRFFAALKCIPWRTSRTLPKCYSRVIRIAEANVPSENGLGDPPPHCSIPRAHRRKTASACSLRWSSSNLRIVLPTRVNERMPGTSSSMPVKSEPLIPATSPLGARCLGRWQCGDRRMTCGCWNRWPSDIESFEAFCRRNGLQHAEGFQLRSGDTEEPIDAVPELAGKAMLDMTKLRECGLIFEFPQNAIVPIPPDRANLRRRGGRSGLAVSKPPHVIVDEARRFAVYSDEFLAVPHAQIGIGGAAAQSAPAEGHFAILDL